MGIQDALNNLTEEKINTFPEASDKYLNGKTKHFPVNIAVRIEEAMGLSAIKLV